MDKHIKLLMTHMPSLAIDLQESLELVQEVLSEIVEEAGDETKKAFQEREFEATNDLAVLAEASFQYERKLDEIIDSLDVEKMEEEILSEEEVPPRNYEKYEVDRNIEHNLYDNFKHKRPFGYQFNKEPMVQVRTWREMYISLSETLFEIDEEKFLAFEDDLAMNGRRKPYYSKDDILLRKPALIGEKIYIETNHSANRLRNLMIRSLKAFAIQPEEVKVFLRADYTNMNVED